LKILNLSGCLLNGTVIIASLLIFRLKRRSLMLRIRVPSWQQFVRHWLIKRRLLTNSRNRWKVYCRKSPVSMRLTLVSR